MGKAIVEALKQLGQVVRALDAIADSLNEVVWELKEHNGREKRG